MKKSISTFIGAIAAFTALLAVSDVGALNILDEHLPDRQIIITTIAPKDNYIYLQNNSSHADNPSLRVVSILTHTEEIDPATLAEQQIWQPTGMTPIAFLIAPQESPIRLTGGKLRLDKTTGLELSNQSTGILYYIANHTDMTSNEDVFTAYKADYRDCLRDAGDNLTNLECRAVSTKNDQIVYEAYLNGEKVIPKVIPTPTAESKDNKAQDHLNYTENILSQNPAHTDSSTKNVKNTNTDEAAAISASTAPNGDSTLPPNNPNNIDSTAISSAATVRSNSKTKDFHWWAIYPLMLVLAILFWFFFILPKKKTRDDFEHQSSK